MKLRTLKSGRKVKSRDKEFDMTISSKCPDKWLFVDLETGNVWHRRNDAKNPQDANFWRGATKVELKDLVKVAKAELKNSEEWEKKHKVVDKTVFGSK